MTKAKKVKNEGDGNKTEEKSSGLMKQLLADEGVKIKLPEVGDLIEGTVIDIGKQSVYLDLGPIGAGVIYGNELQDGFGTLRTLKPGDKIKATVINQENDEGYTELSLRTASYELAWEDIYKKLKEGEIISVRIREANRGGLIAEIYGVKAFLPVSQLSNEHYPRVEEGDKSQILALLNKFVNHEMRVKIIDANKDEEKLIISEKETTAAEERKSISLLKVGDTVEGVISGVVDFGAFVKFGATGEDAVKELEGLVHISEMAWQLIEDPRSVVKIGEKVKAKIIGIDGTRISLSIKALKEDPWQILKYKVGDAVEGKVHKITPYGAFVYLDKDIHGLIHISELGSVEEAKKRLVVGKTEKFKIISLEAATHRMGLALAEKAAKPQKDKETEKPDAEKSAPAAAESKEKETKPEIKKEEKEKIKEEKTKKEAKKKEKTEAKEKKETKKKTPAKKK
jgi:small subunit ribosomal protein S1